MTSLIAGYGEIGRAVGEVIGKHEHTDIEYITSGTYDVLHICFPYDDLFLSEVERYRAIYQPKHVVIYSTVPIGTTRQIPGAVHSPVEGKHPNLAQSIREMVRWIGADDEIEGKFFNAYFAATGLQTRLVPSSQFTEALKLLSTTEYGVNIEFARYKQFVADSLGMDYELCKEFNREYNRLYRALGLDQFQKYVLDAPDGPKGGHCVTPNARLLNDQYPNELVKIVGEL